MQFITWRIRRNIKQEEMEWASCMRNTSNYIHHQVLYFKYICDMIIWHDNVAYMSPLMMTERAVRLVVLLHV